MRFQRALEIWLMVVAIRSVILRKNGIERYPGNAARPLFKTRIGDSAKADQHRAKTALALSKTRFQKVLPEGFWGRERSEWAFFTHC
jgi:hypothetical protein